MQQSFSQTTVATGCPPSSFTAQTQLASVLALSENCGNTPKIHWFIITFSIPIATLGIHPMLRYRHLPNAGCFLAGSNKPNHHL